MLEPRVPWQFERWNAARENSHSSRAGDFRFGIKRVTLTVPPSLPVFPNKRTLLNTVGMSQKVPLAEVNALIRSTRRRAPARSGHGNAEPFDGLQIDHENKLARLLDRKVAGVGGAKDFRDIGARMTKAGQRAA
jgi:hypothetical protein